jgi:hypothetical protein
MSWYEFILMKLCLENDKLELKKLKLMKFNLF